jgi:hypothetical protein
MAAIVIMHVEHVLQTAPDLFAERSICEPGIGIAWDGYTERTKKQPFVQAAEVMRSLTWK